MSVRANSLPQYVLRHWPVTALRRKWRRLLPATGVAMATSSCCPGTQRCFLANRPPSCPDSLLIPSVRSDRVRPRVARVAGPGLDGDGRVQASPPMVKVKFGGARLPRVCGRAGRLNHKLSARNSISYDKLHAFPCERHIWAPPQPGCMCVLVLALMRGRSTGPNVVVDRRLRRPTP